MIAPGMPAAPYGPPQDDASDFQDVLAAMLSGGAADIGPPGSRPSLPIDMEETAAAADADGDETIPGSAGDQTTFPAPPDRADAGAGAQPLVLPGTVHAKGHEPQVLPETAQGKGRDPLVLPGTTQGKGPEPQILPDAAQGKGREPLVLPGAAQAKGLEPQVLPDVAQGKGRDPLILPGTPPGKGLQPQVLPGTAQGKGREPQILPGGTSGEVASGQLTGDSMKLAPDGEEPVQPGRGGQPAVPAPRPDVPALRPLTERTAKPLDEMKMKPEGAADPAAVKSATPAPAVSASGGAAVAKPFAPLAGAAPTADVARAPEPSPGSLGDAPATLTETSAPPRDHSLSTLSRGSIDATAQIAAQIQRRLEGRSTRFEIALRPAELGRVDVKLDIDAEGRLAARLAFDNPAAATDLRGRVDELRRQLEAAGFDLADDAFEFAERDSGSSAFDRGQDARHGQNRAFAAAARLKTEIDVAQPPQWLTLSLSPSGVDMKV